MSRSKVPYGLWQGRQMAKTHSFAVTGPIG